ncbi:type II toxin-antitoxin system HicA family toxin [Sphingomonas sp.]|uniref:type II toxin-antitoxin system HicA family toxin n=1 Tax=Sphingomonas sp. TaxID=28214 RepID=UPI003CC6D4C3
MADDLLERMRTNPRDWLVEDVIRAYRAAGATCTPPRKGSHYKVKHDAVSQILTIPAHRPIKPVYIHALVRFIDAISGANA